MKKILVLMGGFSSEREVSLVSGHGVVEALLAKGYEVIAYDLKNIKDFICYLNQEKPDVIFNALHGGIGENGTIPALLDLLQIPYTHSGLKACAVGMDKNITKEIAKSVAVPVAQSQLMSVKNFFEQKNNLKMPFVVKPIAEGSSVGVFIIKKSSDLEKIKYENLNELLLIEDFVDGKELTAMVLDGKAYCVTELKSSLEFYDYEAKYTPGATQHILPAEVPDDVAKACQKYAVAVHKALGCSQVSRSDFRYNSKDGVIFLEINTHPGMTPLSLVPEQAKYIGISYQELCANLVEGASCNKI